MTTKLRSLSDLRQILAEPPSDDAVHETREHDGKGKSVRIFLDTKGRKGKKVTIVAGLRHNPETMNDIARMLKEYCGAGGTVKDGAIEIQGDQRIRVREKLLKLNYVVSP